MSEGTPLTEVGEFIAQSKQNAESLRALRSDFTSAIDSLRNAIERIGDRLNTATRPNISTFVSICGVMLTVISLVGGVIGFFLWDSIKQGNTNIVGLDGKLQREFQLMITNAEQKYQEADKNSRERNENVHHEIDDIRKWQHASDDADRMELRARRLKDVGIMYQPSHSSIPAFSDTDINKR